jgi:hypothetical protein
MTPCRCSLSAKQAEADAAETAVAEAASREQAAAKAVEDAARRMAELQAELEQLKQDERREHLRIQVRRSSRDDSWSSWCGSWQTRSPCCVRWSGTRLCFVRLI